MNTIASVTLPHHVHAPRYDRQQLQSRIVHFGFGAFHRAHQALLTDRVLNAQGGDWGIDLELSRCVLVCDGDDYRHSVLLTAD